MVRFVADVSDWGLGGVRQPTGGGGGNRQSGSSICCGTLHRLDSNSESEKGDRYDSGSGREGSVGDCSSMAATRRAGNSKARLVIRKTWPMGQSSRIGNVDVMATFGDTSSIRPLQTNTCVRKRARCRLRD